LIADADTGIETWEILHETYSSTDISNVIRIEEGSGRARKSPDENVRQWIGYMRSLAAQLRKVGVEVPANRVQLAF